MLGLGVAESDQCAAGQLLPRLPTRVTSGGPLPQAYTIFQEIAHAIFDDIVNGTYPLGSSLPSNVALGLKHGVSGATAARSISCSPSTGSSASRRASVPSFCTGSRSPNPRLSCSTRPHLLP